MATGTKEKKEEGRPKKNNVKERFDSFQVQINESSTFKNTNDFLLKLSAWAKKNKKESLPLKEMIYAYLDELEFFITPLDRCIEKLEKQFGIIVLGSRLINGKYSIRYKKEGVKKKGTMFVNTAFTRWGYGGMELGDVEEIKEEKIIKESKKSKG